MICFILSGVLALYGAGIGIVAFIGGRMFLNSTYGSYLDKQRNFAKTMDDLNENGVDGQATTKDKKKQKNSNVVKYLLQGLFYAKVLVDEKHMTRSEGNSSKKSKSEKSPFNISFFKIPSLYFD